MEIARGYFILLFMAVLEFAYKKDRSRMHWMHWVPKLTIPQGNHAEQTDRVVAEYARQPGPIQDILPTGAEISEPESGF
jgi:Cytochrome bd-type quinol oxidase, subunit 1